MERYMYKEAVQYSKVQSVYPRGYNRRRALLPQTIYDRREQKGIVGFFCPIMKGAPPLALTALVGIAATTDCRGNRDSLCPKHRA